VPDDDATAEDGLESGEPDIGEAAPGDRGEDPLKDDPARFEFVNRDYLAGMREAVDRAMRPSRVAMDALVRQQASWAKTFVVPDYTPLAQTARQMSESMLAGFDFGRLVPKIDFSEFLRFEPAGAGTSGGRTGGLRTGLGTSTSTRCRRS